MEALETMGGPADTGSWLRGLGRFAAYIALVVVITVALSLGRRASGVDPQGITGQRLYAAQWMIILWVISMATPFLGWRTPRPRSWVRHALWSAVVAIVFVGISYRAAFGF